MYKLTSAVLCVGYFVLGSADPLAPFIHPCGKTDSACILKSAEHALPYFIKGNDALGMVVMDPMVLNDDIVADTGELKLTFKHMTLVGAAKTKFISIDRDLEKETIKIVMELPIDFRGEYALKGILLLFDVYGEGPVKIQTDKMRFNVDVKLKTVEIAGKKYYKIIGSDFKFEQVSKVHLDFENLYNGDETKAEPMKKIMQENSKEVVNSLGHVVIKAAIKEMIKHIDKFFVEVSADELEQ